MQIGSALMACVLAGTLTACGSASSTDVSSGGASSSASALPTDTPEQCVTKVMGLLQDQLQALEKGMGIGVGGTASVITRQAFVYASSRMSADVSANGADGALDRIRPVVRKQCGASS